MFGRHHVHTKADEFSDGLHHRKPTLASKLLLFWFNFTERIAPWYRWPRFTIVPFIYLMIRRRTLAQNLVEVPQPPSTTLARRVQETPSIPEDALPMYRTDDGFGNDGDNPGAGAEGATIGRNMPIVPEAAREATDYPSPQYVAQRLLARKPRRRDLYPDGFTPSKQLNILAAAWIQTMIHDWLDHELDMDKTIILDKGFDEECPVHDLVVHPTRNAALNSGETAYINTRTGWWDASFLYGQTEAAVLEARAFEGGKLKLDTDNDGVPIGYDGSPSVGDQVNNWVGVTMLQNLFIHEHNAIAEAVAAGEPHLDDEGIFQKTRLTVAAVVAKIHTTDWTPTLLNNPTMRSAMHINWGGVLGLGPYCFGLVGAGKARNHGIPYNLTEEFAACYRMNPLLPDNIPVEGGSPIPLADLIGPKGVNYLKENGVSTLWQSMLRFPAGSLQLNNYPATLRNIVPEIPAPDGTTTQLPPTDMAAMEIYRDRERGVPRYNEFRKWLNMRPITSWRELTGGNKEAMDALEEVYGVDVDLCDLVVGNLAEKKIPGFEISETAFLVFLLMASRRLQADRFFTKHFNEKVYGKAGFDWIRRTKSLRDVLKRHYPDLEKELPPKVSCFTPYSPYPTKAATN